MSAQVITPIIVMGVSGCGKTTLARALAKRLVQLRSMPTTFIRLATSFEDARRHAADRRRPGAMARVTNAELRSRAALGERVVLACSALRQRYRDTLAADIAVMHWVFLDGNVDEIAARMRAREGHYMPESLLRSQFDALERPTDAICISVSLTPVEQPQLARLVAQIAARQEIAIAVRAALTLVGPRE